MTPVCSDCTMSGLHTWREKYQSWLCDECFDMRENNHLEPT